MSNYFITHIELASSDIPATQQFYNKLFGWDLQLMQPMNYLMTNFGEGKTTVGFPSVDGKDVKDGQIWVYVNTDDIDDTISQVEAAGGEIAMPKMEIPMTGWMSIINAPGGHQICLFQNMEINELA